MSQATEDLLGRVLDLTEQDRVAFVKSLRRSLRLLGLEIRVNNNETLHCFSRQPTGINVHLYVDEAGVLEMVIRHKTETGRFDYVLRNLQPEDCLAFRFLSMDADFSHEREESNLAQLAGLSRSESDSSSGPGLRLGLDLVFESTENVRICCPERGYFELVMNNGPFEYARTFVAAGRDREHWQWQMPDLYPGQSMFLKIIAADSAQLFRKLR